MAILLEYPKTLMKFRIYTGVLDAATGRESEVETSMWEMPLGEVVLFCLTVGTATLLVHGVHLRAVLEVGWEYVKALTGKGGVGVGDVRVRRSENSRGSEGSVSVGKKGGTTMV